MATSAMLEPCEACGRDTHYRLAVKGKTPPCCGRFTCEVKLRDGVDVAHRAAPSAPLEFQNVPGRTPVTIPAAAPRPPYAELLDALVKWYGSAGPLDSSVARFDFERLARQAYEAGRESAKVEDIRVGDIIVYARAPKYRVDEVLTDQRGKRVAEMTMIENDWGKPVSCRQLGGPCDLEGAFVIERPGDLK